MKWTRFEDAASLAVAAANRIIQCAGLAIELRGRFTLVLAGGGTPAATYELLAQEESDWKKWHIYFGDERCLDREDPQRNSQMAYHALLSKVPIPPEQIYPIPGELGADKGANRYSELIREVPPFDMVLLGIGEDGHTASLFPGHDHTSQEPAIAIHNAPKPPADRISLTPATLGSCRQLLILISGPGKRDAVREWREGAPLPISLIRSQGETEVLIDRSADPD